MRQVLVIHGGDTFDTYEDYLSFLQNFKLDGLQDILKNGWKRKLQEDLGNEYQVLAPTMPNALNAKYVEWQIWFEKIIPFLHDDLIWVGHSLGGIFTAKYLSENKFPKKIKAVFLVCPPFDSVTQGESLADFILPNSLESFANQVGKITLYHSTDDKVVPFASTEKFKEKLLKAEVVTFEDRGHFTQESFPELVAAIKSLN